MTATGDIVMVASGTMVQVELWHAALADAGIDAKVVGEDLTAGLGTAIPASVELWVHQGDFDRATAILQQEEAEKESAQAAV